MHSWTHLLEALHSALIDELCLLAPEPKPELGLPVRASGLIPPGLPPERSLVYRVSIQSPLLGSGYAVLTLTSDVERHLMRSIQTLWDSVIERARRDEFPRRSLSARFEALAPLRTNLMPRIMIWIPIRLNGGLVHLGVGI